MKETKLNFDARWEGFTKRINKRCLGLSGLRAIEDEALLLMHGKDEEHLFRILEKIEEKRHSLRHAAPVLKDLHKTLPLACEFDASNMESTFLSRMRQLAKMIAKQNSMEPFCRSLSETQQREVLAFSGACVSPEVLARGVEEYANSLCIQMKAAEAFSLGQIEEGKRLFPKIPSHILGRIEDLMERDSVDHCVRLETIVQSILQVIEEQMGLHEIS